MSLMQYTLKNGTVYDQYRYLSQNQFNFSISQVFCQKSIVIMKIYMNIVTLIQVKLIEEEYTVKVYRCPIKICYQDQDKKCHLVFPKCPYISLFFAYIELPYFEFPHISSKFFAFKKVEISGPKCTLSPSTGTSQKSPSSFALTAASLANMSPVPSLLLNGPYKLVCVHIKQFKNIFSIGMRSNFHRSLW